ncbi:MULTISPECIES: molybdopterin-guanine dinucleotide biosynthesis protein MobB [unclassified Lentimonas]|uniref:molybdopterin-guanine dinucleotide biosynthesis protein MobB n=1 Tax=unclassified Lentimonas TaxID=2630993 RepID=UPI001321229F|nr:MULTISPECIES: molybdopterin-guanine dinucleotide biosynthesis protein MobB [unclassified Lentimonas]CAA6679582.1 Unannotated [Lentimonas sp. CC4]CAA6687300.1 Unannotated [Lentimonas sp. CC6]CAA7077195.1 Unannotated [Lentimonas sp. CC4]CAA7171786.1 Unannotated [Lentimonas sp. CC21]CAA7183431.1 Unannotated [Lentimonas sp. CC8]
MKASANPFRSSSIEKIRYMLEVDTLEALADRALRQACSCLLGAKGTGKTTLLEDLEPLLQQRGYTTHWCRLNLDSTPHERRKVTIQLQDLKPQQVCLFDGAEVLNFWQWRRICRTARSNGFTLIATLHRKRGVPILRQTEVNWPLAHQFVRQLAGDYYSDTLCKHAEKAFYCNHGNMREVFRACYLALAQENPLEFEK